MKLLDRNSTWNVWNPILRMKNDPKLSKNGWNWAVILSWCFQRPNEAESTGDWPNRIQRRSFGAHALTNGALSNLVPFILVKKTTFGRFKSKTSSAKLNRVKNPLKSRFRCLHEKNLRKWSEIKNFISVDEKNAHKCWSLKMRLFLAFLILL